MRQLATAVIIATAIALDARAASAQGDPKLSIAGGYACLGEQGPGNLGPTNYPAGWVATGAYRIASSRLFGAGEVTVNARRNVFDERQQLLGILGGGGYWLVRGSRLSLFAQTLVGLERFSEPGLVESGLAVQPGVGLDIRVGSKGFIRVQGDYRMSKQDTATFHDIRVWAGVGIKIG